MSEVHVKEGESLDSALKRFKRSCAKAGVLAEVRRRECYESPSVKRRKKSEAARKNRNKRYYESSQKACWTLCSARFILSKRIFDKMSTHFQNFHKSSENAVIENERHP